MIKLLETYLASPTRSNARKARDHAYRYSVQVCLLSDAYAAVLKTAIRHANHKRTK